MVAIIKNNYPHIRTWIAVLEYADAVTFICNIYLIKFTKKTSVLNLVFFFLNNNNFYRRKRKISVHEEY
jgi:hypothetical protein